METKNPRNTTEWQKRTRAAKAHAKKHGTPCWVCGDPIKFDVPYTDPMAFTLDHVEEIAAGGAVLRGAKLEPAHRGCNSRRSNTRAARARQGRAVGTKPLARAPLAKKKVLELTTTRPFAKAQPVRFRQPGPSEVITTIDWAGDGVPLYKK